MTRFHKHTHTHARTHARTHAHTMFTYIPIIQRSIEGSEEVLWNRDLVFDKVQGSDSGYYTCLFGSEQVGEIYLKVLKGTIQLVNE